MKYKRRMIAMILAVFLFAIATASASDVSDTAIATGEPIQMELAVNDVGFDEDFLVMAGDNVLDFSLKEFISYSKEKNSSCVMCHEEDRIEALRKTAVITIDEKQMITSYEEKPAVPKGNLAVPPFYFYKADDIKRISEALKEGCAYDAPGSFAAWLSKKSIMYAYMMPGKRYDIGDINSYKKVCDLFSD